MTTNVTQMVRARTAAPPPDARNDIREFLLAARRQVWLVVICGLAGLALGVFHYGTSPKLFHGSATILIEEKQTDPDQEISALRPVTRSDTGFQNQLQILQSQEVAADVVRALGLADNPAFLDPPRSILGEWKRSAKRFVKDLLPEPARPATGATGDTASREEARIRKAASLLARETQFSRVGKSYSVEVGYLSHDPRLAVDIANAYAEAYLADGIEANVAESDRTAAWMRDRIEHLRQEALAASADAEAFRMENGAMDQQGLREREQRVDALNELYVTMEARYQENLLSETFPVANGRILSRALPPTEPAAPRAWQILLSGLVLGLLGGMTLATYREMRETGVRTGGDLRRLGVAFLGYLPDISPKSRATRSSGPANRPDAPLRSGFASSRSVPITSGPVALNQAEPLLLETPLLSGVISDDLVLAPLGAGSPAERALRNILASIDLAFDAGRPRVIAIGGLYGGEGATTLAANLALVAAQTGGRTLLIDGDLDAAALSERVGARGHGGVSDLHDDARDLQRATRRLPGTSLDILPVQSAGPATADGALSASFRPVIDAARRSYDTIFVDMAPLAQSADAKVWLRSIDGVVLAVRWGETSLTAVDGFLDAEPELRARMIGGVVCRTDLRRNARYGARTTSPPRHSIRASI